MSEDIIFHTIINDCSIKSLEPLFSFYKLKVKSPSIQLEFEKLVVESMNNVRLHANRGFTNKELEKLSYV